MAESTTQCMGTVTRSSAHVEACAFTDKLPVELRIQIYKEVLKCKYSLLLVHHEYTDEVRFNVSILATCKFIYAEAFDILFEVNTIALWRQNELSRAVREDHRFLHSVRQLELVNLEIPAWLPASKKELHKALDICLDLPRLKSLTIAGDIKDSRLFEYLEVAFGSDNLHCVEIGKVCVNFDERRTFYVKHYGITKALQELSTAKKTVKLRHDWAGYRKRLGQRGVHALRCDFVKDCGLRTFCFLVDLLRTPLQRIPMETLEFVLDFKTRLTWKSDRYQALAKLGNHSRLKNVLLGKHDPRMARLLTEILLDYATIFPEIVAI